MMYSESIMVNVKLKSFIDRQVIKRKEAKYTATNLRRKTAREEKGQKNNKKNLIKQTKQKVISKMMIVDPYLSIIILMVNGLNCLIKRQSH